MNVRSKRHVRMLLGVVLLIGLASLLYHGFWIRDIKIRQAAQQREEWQRRVTAFSKEMQRLLYYVDVWQAGVTTSTYMLALYLDSYPDLATTTQQQRIADRLPQMAKQLITQARDVLTAYPDAAITLRRADGTLLAYLTRTESIYYAPEITSDRVYALDPPYLRQFPEYMPRVQSSFAWGESLFFSQQQGEWLLRMARPFETARGAFATVLVEVPYPFNAQHQPEFTITPADDAVLPMVPLKSFDQAQTRAQKTERWFWTAWRVAVPGGQRGVILSLRFSLRELWFLYVAMVAYYAVLAGFAGLLIWRVQTVLEDQEILTDVIIDHIPGTLIFVKDMDGQFLFCNRAFCDFYKTTQAAVLSSHPYFKAEDEFVRNGKTDRVEEVVQDRVFRNEKIPLKSKNGDMIGILFLKHDITQLAVERLAQQHAAQSFLGILQQGMIP